MNRPIFEIVNLFSLLDIFLELQILKGYRTHSKKMKEDSGKMNTFCNENSLLGRMDKVLNIRTVTMKREEPCKGMGLVAKVLIKAGFVLKDIKPALGFRFDPCFDARGMKYIDSLPWLQNSNHKADKLDIHALEETIQEFVCCLKTLGHSVEKDQFCAQGGCFKCGLHPTLFAALLLANFDDFSNQKSPYNQWVKNMCIDKDIVLNSLQFFEILMVTNFLLKSETRISAEMMPEYVQYVWTVVKVFKTCSYSLYAPIQTPEHEAYNHWTELIKQKIIAFTKMIKNKGPKSEADVLEGKALQEMMNKSPPPPQDFSVCFFSVHHQISYINGEEISKIQNEIKDEHKKIQTLVEKQRAIDLEKETSKIQDEIKDEHKQLDRELEEEISKIQKEIKDEHKKFKLWSRSNRRWS